jgi:tetratricopeptide (TPR) repeat protein
VPKTTTDGLEQAQSLFASGDFGRCREVVLEALQAHPQDPGLLRLAGKASLELDLDDAAGYLEQAARLEPENPDAWRDLADALLYEGRVDDAAAAIQHAVELRPDDVASLVDLAHVAHASGRTDVAITYLEQVLERDFGNLAALRGLVDMSRGAGKLEQALDAARKLVSYTPDDVFAALDVAELNLALERLEDAVDAFRWLRDVDDEPDHEVFAYHGMIEAELRRERWRAALDLAVDATRVDRFGRTTDVLAFVVAQVFGASGRPAPARRDIDDALAASRDEHRRLHTALGL